jgi:hypothetical protein
MRGTADVIEPSIHFYPLQRRVVCSATHGCAIATTLNLCFASGGDSQYCGPIEPEHCEMFGSGVALVFCAAAMLAQLLCFS